MATKTMTLGNNVYTRNLSNAIQVGEQQAHKWCQRKHLLSCWGPWEILNKSNNNLQRWSLEVENCKGQLFLYQVMDGFYTESLLYCCRRNGYQYHNFNELPTDRHFHQEAPVKSGLRRLAISWKPEVDIFKSGTGKCMQFASRSVISLPVTFLFFQLLCK